MQTRCGSAAMHRNFICDTHTVQYLQQQNSHTEIYKHIENVLSLLSMCWRLSIYIKESLTHIQLKIVQFGLDARVKLALQIAEVNTCLVHLNQKDFHPG